MPVLAHYTRQVDGTIPVPALLYDDERLLASQDSVGLYDGPNKSAPHQSGTLHISSHRLFFIAGAPSASPIHAPPSEREGGASLALDLGHISHTESYLGFFKSSPKVTLHLRPLDNDVEVTTVDTAPSPGAPHGDASKSLVSLVSSPESSRSPGGTDGSDSPFNSWACEICGYSNPPGLSPAARSVCGLCGMPRSASTSATPLSSVPRSSNSMNLISPVPIALSRSATLSVGNAQIYSRSLPSSSVHTPAPLLPSSSPPSREDGGERSRNLSSLACPACTFLNHPSLQECEICGTKLRGADVDSNTDNQMTLFASKSAPTSRPSSPERGDNELLSKVDERERYIRLSFRRGGDKAFYAALKTALQQKGWESRPSTKWNSTRPAQESSAGFSGISGILQSMDSATAHTEQGMSDAFSDLEALMSKAQVMVRLAKDLNEQLTAASRNPSSSEEQLEPEEATFVRSSLAQLGLSMKNTPVTADMSGDERRYTEQLALELAGVLEGGTEVNDKGKVGIMKKRGVVGLDEVWGGWNRARGVALISPDMALKTLPYLPLHTHPPIHTRLLASGLRVLYTPAYSLNAFTARFIAMVVDKGPRTTTEVAGDEGLSVGLVDELVKEVEERGDVCRDDPMSGINVGGGVGVEMRWWANTFTGYVWDGQTD